MSQSGTYGSGGSMAGNFEVIGTVFTTNGTWTKNANTRWMTVFVVSGGNGGGSGRRGSSTASSGGGGGSGGTNFTLTFPESYFSSTEAVVVGSGGSGGAAQTVDNTDGNDGTAGVLSSFAGISIDSSLSGSSPYGLGGVSSGFAQGGLSAALSSNFMDGTGIQGNTLDGLVSSGGLGLVGDGVDGGLRGNSFTSRAISLMCNAGGGGGGADSGTERSGGDGKSANLLWSTNNDIVLTFAAGGSGGVESGTINGGTGVNGALNNFGTYLYYGSGGGGGGGQSGGAVAGNGGNGGFPGGGGGGSLNGTNSGSGGDGANGVVMVLEYIYT